MGLSGEASRGAVGAPDEDEVAVFGPGLADGFVADEADRRMIRPLSIGGAEARAQPPASLLPPPGLDLAVVEAALHRAIGIEADESAGSAAGGCTRTTAARR